MTDVKQTGAEIKAKVRSLAETNRDAGLVAALDGCVLLTAEEARYVRNVLRFGSNGPPKQRYTDTALRYAGATDVEIFALTPADNTPDEDAA